MQVKQKSFAVIALVLLAFLSPLVLFWNPQISIIEPKSGTIVHPGDTVRVRVSTSGAIFLAMMIEPETPIGGDSAWLPPYRFRIHIPPRLAPGIYWLTASGTTIPGHGAESEAVSLDVERPDLPIALSTEPRGLRILHPGEKANLRVLGKYRDGVIGDLTSSGQTTWLSSNQNVVRLERGGVVNARMPGKAEISLRVGDQIINMEVMVLEW